MFDDIVKRLALLGYLVLDADKWLVEHLISTVSTTIKNECNIDEIPPGLRYVAIDMVVGEFLRIKKASGGLEGFDVEHAVSAIKQGDTSLSFALGNDVITLDSLITVLIEGHRSQLARFRRILW